MLASGKLASGKLASGSEASALALSMGSASVVSASLAASIILLSGIAFGLGAAGSLQAVRSVSEIRMSIGRLVRCIPDT
jgi:hypothetical protein